MDTKHGDLSTNSKGIRKLKKEKIMRRNLRMRLLTKKQKSIDPELIEEIDFLIARL
jgi:hypothetical protein